MFDQCNYLQGTEFYTDENGTPGFVSEIKGVIGNVKKRAGSVLKYGTLSLATLGIAGAMNTAGAHISQEALHDHDGEVYVGSERKGFNIHNCGWYASTLEKLKNKTQNEILTNKFHIQTLQRMKEKCPYKEKIKMISYGPTHVANGQGRQQYTGGAHLQFSGPGPGAAKLGASIALNNNKPTQYDRITRKPNPHSINGRFYLNLQIPEANLFVNDKQNIDSVVLEQALRWRLSSDGYYSFSFTHSFRSKLGKNGIIHMNFNEFRGTKEIGYTYIQDKEYKVILTLKQGPTGFAGIDIQLTSL